MKSAKVNTHLNVEVLAYAISKYFIDHTYKTNVIKKTAELLHVYIIKERTLRGVLGNPTIIQVALLREGEGIGIEVKEIFGETNIETVLKEISYSILIIPGLKKRIEASVLEGEVFKRVLTIIKSKMKEGKG